MSKLLVLAVLLVGSTVYAKGPTHKYGASRNTYSPPRYSYNYGNRQSTQRGQTMYYSPNGQWLGRSSNSYGHKMYYNRYGQWIGRERN